MGERMRKPAAENKIQRVIYLSATGKSVPLGNYVSVLKAAKANPRAIFSHGLCGWWPVTGAEIIKEFVAGLEDRISQGVSYSKRGLV